MRAASDNSRNDPGPSRWVRFRRHRPAFRSLAFFYVAYVVAGGLGQGLALIPGVSILFWPPVGILIAILLLNPRASWAWWVLTGGLAELTCNAVWFHSPLPYALIYYGGNALESLTAAWLLAGWLPKPFRLESLEEVAAFVVLGAGVAPTVSATVIAVTDALLGKHPFLTAWPLVWLGDGTGLLVSAPLTLAAVLVWRERANIPPRRLLEGVVLGLLLLAVCILSFHGFLPTVYVSLPLIVWAAARFQVQGAAVAMGLVTLTTAAFTMTGRGEFTGRPELLYEKAIMLQTFLGVSATSALVVGALSLLRQQALQALQAANTGLEARVAERTAALYATKEQLQDSDRRKDEFLATLAHELRNPLSPVRTAVQFLRLRSPAVPELQPAVAVIDRQVQAMTRLIDDLMDVSRISHGKIELRRERIELATAVQQAVETSRSLLEAMGHHLVVSLPSHPVFLDADLTRLSQVFHNLLSNACKYMERGGRIELHAEREGSGVLVSVRDHGIGIPADKLPALFEMFSQVEGTRSRSQGGLGIGLYLVKQLVELHGGRVEAHSEGPGQGSEFVVHLPAVSEPAPRSDSREGAGGKLETPSGLRILVVDDNRDAADSLATLLDLMGNDVQTAYDGEAAVTAAGELRPQVVLCDIGLPKLNGYEVCRRIRHEPWGDGMIFVALTGWGQDEDKRNAREAGFDHHMVKPVSPSTLMTLLASLQIPAGPAGDRRGGPKGEE